MFPLNNTYNLGHNILKLYNVFVLIRLKQNMSKPKHDTWSSNLGMQVTS